MSVTLSDVERVEAALRNTTDGAPGTRALSSQRRLIGSPSLAYGTGTANARRAVLREETTCVDATLLVGAGLGLAAYVYGR